MKNIIVALTFLSFAACAHKQAFKDLNAWNETPEQSLQLSLRSIKAKRTKADVVVAVKNMYPYPVVLQEGAIHYSVNGDDGIANNPSVRRILNTGDTAAFAMSFRFAVPEEGTGVLKLENIYSGKGIEVSGVTANSSTNSFGLASASAQRIGNTVSATGSGSGSSNTRGNAETYQRKSATEDQPLPPVTLLVPN